MSAIAGIEHLEDTDSESGSESEEEEEEMEEMEEEVPELIPSNKRKRAQSEDGVGKRRKTCSESESGPAAKQPSQGTAKIN